MAQRFVDRWVRRTDDLGCCGSLIRTLLLIVNLFIFTLGIFMFILAGLLKFGSTFPNEFQHLKFVQDLIRDGQMSNATTALTVISIILMAFSMVGICATRIPNKSFLVAYEIVVFILFLVHAVTLIVLLSTMPFIEEHYTDGLNYTINNLNENKEYKENCELMAAFSAVFECCGKKGPSDFLNKTIAETCCSPDINNRNETYQDGCLVKSINEYKRGVNYLIFPSLLILLFELFVMITVPFLIGRIRHYQSF